MTVSTSQLRASDIALRSPTIDQVGIEERVERLQKRSIKKESKIYALKLALSMIDLTTLEGADSPIEAMLAGEPATTNGQRPTNGEHKPTATGGDSKGNLADRIRALQLKASRVPVTN